MGHLYYNRLTNNRIKSATLQVITVAAFLLFTSYIRTADTNTINSYHGLGFGFLLIGLVCLLGLIPFGQVLESFDSKEFMTYYRLGRLKFKQRKWDKADKVFLEQDQKRFYCLTIATANGKTFQIEKYPTLDKADERLMEFKKLFD